MNSFAMHLKELETLLSAPTPIQFCMNWKGAEIYIKREDLLPFSFGGNKVRFVLESLREMQKGGFDALVSYGSPASNLNRAAAHFAAACEIPCSIIYKLDGEDAGRCANARMVLESGAELISCTKEEVGKTVAQTLEKLKNAGKKPYYIYGNADGHGAETVLARPYERIYRALSENQADRFSHIFLAAGTGMTQTGLLAGAFSGDAHERDTIPICGISVARKEEICRRQIIQNLELVLGRRLSKEEQSKVFVTDRCLCGGYGKADASLLKMCKEMLCTCGLPLDTVYTGKAFYGMLQEIARNKLEGRILFLHTGGLPGFFDDLEKRTVF